MTSGACPLLENDVIPGMMIFSLLCGALVLHIYVAMMDDSQES